MKIITDSSSDLPKDLKDKNEIIVIPMSIEVDGAEYIDGVDLSHNDFYKKMEKSKSLPKTSQPSTGTFLNVYQQFIEADEEIISIHMSSEISGTYEGAMIAAKEIGRNIHVFDSRLGTMGTGLVTVKAAQLARKGFSCKKIISILEAYRSNVNVVGYLDSLKNAVKGGRVNPSKRIITELMNIKPITKIINGQVKVVYYARGKQKTYQYLLDMINDSICSYESVKLVIVHCDAEKEAMRLQSMITEQTGIKDITVTTMGPVNSTHVGIGGISICYAPV
ncbi:DegV family protein [Tindallia californiensis]|uniref:EDD domain protein, DegV family n=1 Tax=Tindallia californiensis TaxID=159292 RepID=A0A1H3N9W3_9FIRM|nr:DegV family protein [Tindallia californiensis]SDY85255.1 EDD domain protein, DegV family [Tindallia californiensis]